MQPTTKAVLIVAGCMSSVIILPVILLILRDFIPIIILISCVVYCLYLICYHGYQDLLPFIQREQIQEEQIFHAFNGDPEKIRFYKGFKKYFDGDLNSEQLKQWFIKHPLKH